MGQSLQVFTISIVSDSCSSLNCHLNANRSAFRLMNMQDCYEVWTWTSCKWDHLYAIDVLHKIHVQLRCRWWHNDTIGVTQHHFQRHTYCELGTIKDQNYHHLKKKQISIYFISHLYCINWLFSHCIRFCNSKTGLWNLDALPLNLNNKLLSFGDLCWIGKWRQCRKITYSVTRVNGLCKCLFCNDSCLHIPHESSTKGFHYLYLHLSF